MNKSCLFSKAILCWILISCYGCSKQYEFKSTQIIGYWKAIQVSEVTKNGEKSSVYEKRFYTQFYDNNCGVLYDADEIKTNNIKWALQENESEDILFISTALNANGQTSDFSINTLSIVEKISKKRFQTYLIENDTINEDVFVKVHRTYYSR